MKRLCPAHCAPLLLLSLLTACGGDASQGRLVPGELAFATRSDALGPFDLLWEGSGWADARLRVVHRDRPTATVFATRPGLSFLEIARGRARVSGEGARARVVDDVQERCADLTVDSIEAELYALLVRGRMRCSVLDRSFEMFVVPEGQDELRFHVRLTDASFNRVGVSFARPSAQPLVGLGARDRATVAGSVPLWVLPGAAASRVPVPHLVSPRGLWAVELESPEYAHVEAGSERVRMTVFASELTWRVQRGAAPLDLVRVASAAAGRGEPLPAWVHRGPIVRVRGGAAQIRAAVATLATRGVTPAAVQVEGWARPGTSLELDRERHPAWDELVGELAAAGIRILLDASPVVAEGPAGADSVRDAASVEGHWVIDSEGAPYQASHRGVPSRWLDLSSASVREFWADALERKLLGIGAAGWVVSGGATLPFAARLAGDRDAAGYHNRYADAVVRASRRAIREAERPEAVVLTDTGFVHAPRHTPILLAGEAGDPASFARLLSAGLSGYAYAALDADAGGTPAARRRSVQLAALAPVYRIDAGVLSDPEALDVLAGVERLRARLADHRDALIAEAAGSGAPVLRAVWLHHPDAPDALADVPALFTLGSDLLVAPAFDPEASEVDVRLPPGRFVDLFGGGVHEGRVRLAAPAGAAILHAEGSAVGEALRAALASASE